MCLRESVQFTGSVSYFTFRRSLLMLTAYDDLSTVHFVQCKRTVNKLYRPFICGAFKLFYFSCKAVLSRTWPAPTGGFKVSCSSSVARERGEIRGQQQTFQVRRTGMGSSRRTRRARRFFYPRHHRPHCYWSCAMKLRTKAVHISATKEGREKASPSHLLLRAPSFLIRA